MRQPISSNGMRRNIRNEGWNRVLHEIEALLLTEPQHRENSRREYCHASGRRYWSWNCPITIT
jgi:hypothetical protein